jgi:hypothetical protein
VSGATAAETGTGWSNTIAAVIVRPTANIVANADMFRLTLNFRIRNRMIRAFARISNSYYLE